MIITKFSVDFSFPYNNTTFEYMIRQRRCEHNIFYLSVVTFNNTARIHCYLQWASHVSIRVAWKFPFSLVDAKHRIQFQSFVSYHLTQTSSISEYSPSNHRATTLFSILFGVKIRENHLKWYIQAIFTHSINLGTMICSNKFQFTIYHYFGTMIFMTNGIIAIDNLTTLAWLFIVYERFHFKTNEAIISQVLYAKVTIVCHQWMFI